MPLVRQADPAILKRRPAPGEWSIHENACHLAEVHPLFFRRLDLMLAETDPLITSYDPGRDDPDDALLKLDLGASLLENLAVAETTALLDAPNDHLTRLEGNKLWQLGLLELWLHHIEDEVWRGDIEAGR